MYWSSRRSNLTNGYLPWRNDSREDKRTAMGITYIQFGTSDTHNVIFANKAP